MSFRDGGGNRRSARTATDRPTNDPPEIQEPKNIQTLPTHPTSNLSEPPHSNEPHPSSTNSVASQETALSITPSLQPPKLQNTVQSIQAQLDQHQHSAN